MKIFKQIRQKFKRNVEESVPNELETKSKSRPKRRRIRNVMAIAGIVVAAFVGVNSMSVRAATSGNVNGVIHQGGVAFSANGSWSVSASRSGNTVTVTVNGSLTIPNGCWEGLSLYVTNNKGAGDRSVQIAADGSAWPKTGSGSTSYSFTDANAGTASGRIYLGFRSNPTRGLWADYSIGYSSGAKKEHKVHYDLNGGSWNTSAITNPNGYKIIEDGNYQIQWGYNSSYYIHTKSSNAQALGIHMWQDSSNENSIWYFERYQNTPYYFIVGDNGWNLASYGTERVDEANQVNDSSRNNHLWAIVKQSNGKYALKNVGTGTYIFSHYGSAGNGNAVGLYSGVTGDDVTWNLVKKATGTSAYRKKLQGNSFYVNQKTPVKPGYIFNGWASRPEWETRAKSVSINGRTFDRYFIQPIGGNRFEVMVHTTDSRITQVSVPVWSDANGQDDLQWPTLGKGTWTRDGQSFNWGAQITIPEEISHYSMHIYTGINGAWEEASGSSGLDSVWTIGEQYTFDTNTDGTMYATWRKDDTQYQQTVNVRFENADGTYTGYQQAYQQTVKAGETFSWKYPESSIYQSASISEKVTGTKTHNVTVYRKKYTATFDANGGTTASPKTLTRRAQQPLGTLPTTSRSGYTFQGWYTAKTGGTKISTSTTMPTQNTTYYAHWVPASYTVTYKANGGSGTDQTQSVQYGTVWTTKGAVFTRTGYTLSSWNTKADGSGTKYGLNTKQTDKQSSNLTLYAQWQVNTYTYNVKYVSTSGVQLGTGTVSGTFGSSKSVSPKTFTGYTSPAAQTVKFDSTTAKTITFKYTPISYKITYTLNGGSVTGNPSTYTIETATITLKNPTKTGYTFKGWTGSNGTTPQTTVKIAKGSTGNKSYTANWALASATQTIRVRYQNADGTFGNYQQAYQKDYAIGSTFTWEYAGNATYKPASVSYKVTGARTTDVTIYRKEYTATFDANGGTTASPKTLTRRAQQPLGTLPTTSRSGYTFQGWYTAKTGGTKISTSTTMPTQNTTYYAQWKPASYTITYKANGGSGADQTQSVQYGTAWTTKGAIFTKTGYTLSSWNTKADGSGTKYSLNTKQTDKQSSNLTLYAQWSPITYIVRYHANGGTGTMKDQTLTYDKKEALSPNAFTGPDNQAWVGWNTKADGTGKSVMSTSDDPVALNLASKQDQVIDLYAQWGEIAGRIDYELNGGIDPGNPTSYSTTTKDFTLMAPTKTGYTFTGWTGSNGTTPQKTVTIKKGTTGNMFYEAHWKANTYTLVYNGNGSTSGSMSNQTLTYDKEHTLTKNAFAKNGYIFAGWNTKANGSGTKYNDADKVKNLANEQGSTITLYAQWTKKIVTLTFDGNGGSDGGTIEKQSTLLIGTLPTSSRSGYTFLGWYTAKSGGTKITETTVVPNQNTTYYAHWKGEGFNITYDLDGGKVSGNPDSYTPESATITLKNPTKTGHTFLGWTGTGLNGLTMNVTIPKGSTGDRHYTANWKAHTYTIKYNGNGSTSGSTATSTHTYGVAKNLTENGFKRTGYTFAGWNTKADGSGTSYKNTQSVKNLTASDGAIVNLYARWYVNKYTVTFNPNMDASSNTVTIYAGTRDETLHRADGSTYTDKSGGTRTKYVLTFNKADHEKGLLSVTIKGLYGALDGTVRKVESVKTSIVDFDPSIATKVITFDPNGGTCETESARFTVNSKLNSLPTPQREGYTFDGWFTSPDGGTRVTTSTPLGDEDRTVYAHWTAKTFTIKYHGNNGSYNGKETYEDTVQWGVNYEVSPNFFTRSGWRFKGWNTASDGSGEDWTGKIGRSEAWRIDSDVTLYAQWSK